MKNNELFHSFRYVVGNILPIKKQVEVKVFYIYQDVYSIPLPLLIKKVKRKDDAYYLDEAKKIINRMIEDGSLKKYSDEYIKEEKKKKFLLLFFLPFFSACAIAGASVGIYFALNRAITYEVSCDVNNVTIVKPEAKRGEDYVTQITFAPTTKVTLPRELDKVLINGVETTDYTYTLNYGSLTADFFISAKYVTGKVEIFLTPSEIKKWYNHTDWYYYCSSGVEGEEADDEDVGQIVKLKVNNQDHNVRLIGLDHDELSDGSGEAHTTFQFSNLLCDENGHSFGVIEDFDSDGYVARNYDYLNSILRKNLTGKGKSNNMWFQKGDTDISQEYKNMTVLDMLPQGLKDVLKDVKKEIYTDVDQQWEFKLTYYDDKLFVPTYREMFKEGSDYDYNFYGDEGTTYNYYLKDSPERTFKQISDDICSDCSKINIFGGVLTVENYAGYCTGDPASDTLAFFASPMKDSHDNVFGIYFGTFDSPPTTNSYAFGIAPCFCI